MMKKVWENPVATVEAFAANEAVSACVESPDTYYFVCDAGNPNIGYNNVVYAFSEDYAGNVPAFEVTSHTHKVTGSYKPCGSTHEAKKSDDFTRGFVDTNFDGKYTAGVDADCIVWFEHGCGSEDVHCCTNLNLNSYSKNLS